MSYIKVENELGLVRDPNTGALLNTDRTELSNAKERKRLRKIKDAELEELKKDVDDIKVLLKQIIGKLDGS
jgi:hypothetical protein